MNKIGESGGAGNKIKRIRQAKILDIITNNSITTQDELTKKLKEAGFDATQATISRDIRELKLTKSSDKNGAYKYTAKETTDKQSENKYEKILVEASVSVVNAMNLVIVKTYAGMANAACAAFDRLAWEEVAGSIAGDDTIFIACYTEHDAKVVLERLGAIIKK